MAIIDPVFADQVGILSFDNVRFTDNPDVPHTIRTNQVERLLLHETRLSP
jgi:hypothetical protein